MSTLSQSTTPRTTKAGTNTSPKEQYGGENLPVLIQLPDLSEDDQGLPPVPQALETAAEELATTDQRSSIRLADIHPDHGETVESESGEAVEPDHGETVESESGTDQPPAAAPREPGLREQRQQRRERVTRRSERIASMPTWLRGMSQLAFAALLAGVLLAIVVTLKNWNAPTRTDSERHDGVPLVEAPTIDIAPAGSQGAFTTPLADGPSLGPPTFTGHAPSQEGTALEDRTLNGRSLERTGLENGLPPLPPGPAFDTRGRSQPASYGEQALPRNAVPARPGAMGHTAGTIQYPTTGVQPVSSAAGMSAEQVGRGWPETLPLGPVHNAERPAPPAYDQQYNQRR